MGCVVGNRRGEQQAGYRAGKTRKLVRSSVCCPSHLGSWEGELGWSLLGDMTSMFTTVGLSSRMLRHNTCESHSIPCPSLLICIPLGFVLITGQTNLKEFSGLHRETSIMRC